MIHPWHDTGSSEAFLSSWHGLKLWSIINSAICTWYMFKFDKDSVSIVKFCLSRVTILPPPPPPKKRKNSLYILDTLQCQVVEFFPFDLEKFCLFLIFHKFWYEWLRYFYFNKWSHIAFYFWFSVSMRYNICCDC